MSQAQAVVSPPSGPMLLNAQVGGSGMELPSSPLLALMRGYAYDLVLDLDLVSYPLVHPERQACRSDVVPSP